ncbi:hypothetical protein B9Z55_027325 [Caenorhabditis nigoni]|uniref:Uncharacterized protein n=1 Tax=Caenorhabditis nigoni TaxID=1611254 RepID=A0A2G5SGH1_9PELO|nr:hypothetical protein B9Z55_027325 [Caenorhabditis nigoni]
MTNRSSKSMHLNASSTFFKVRQQTEKTDFQRNQTLYEPMEANRYEFLVVKCKRKRSHNANWQWTKKPNDDDLIWISLLRLVASLSTYLTNGIRWKITSNEWKRFGISYYPDPGYTVRFSQKSDVAEKEFTDEETLLELRCVLFGRFLALKD